MAEDKSRVHGMSPVQAFLSPERLTRAEINELRETWRAELPSNSKERDDLDLLLAHLHSMRRGRPLHTRVPGVARILNLVCATYEKGKRNPSPKEQRAIQRRS